MKKHFFITILIAIVTNAQDSTSLDPYQFFPANVGDRWEYTYAGPDQFYSIARDSIDSKDGSRIIFYDRWTAYNPIKNRYPLYRIDKNFNAFNDPLRDNRYVYKLDANMGDSWIVRAEDYQAAKVLDISESYIFGKLTTVKTIGFYLLTRGDTVITENSILQYWEKLAYGFGLISREDGATQPYLLRGCRINGITYGTVDVKGDSQTIPSEFALYQNYPNPFNPATQINFAIPEAGFVSLKIYDQLGREVATLIDEFKLAGNYSASFESGKFNLASGVYYYHLRAGKFQSTKRMVLIK